MATIHDSGAGVFVDGAVGQSQGAIVIDATTRVAAHRAIDQSYSPASVVDPDPCVAPNRGVGEMNCGPILWEVAAPVLDAIARVVAYATIGQGYRPTAILDTAPRVAADRGAGDIRLKPVLDAAAKVFIDGAIGQSQAATVADTTAALAGRVAADSRVGQG